MGKSNSEEKKSITNVQNLYKKAKSLERQLLLETTLFRTSVQSTIIFFKILDTPIFFSSTIHF